MSLWIRYLRFLEYKKISFFFFCTSSSSFLALIASKLSFSRISFFLILLEIILSILSLQYFSLQTYNALSSDLDIHEICKILRSSFQPFSSGWGVAILYLLHVHWKFLPWTPLVVCNQHNYGALAHPYPQFIPAFSLCHFFQLAFWLSQNFFPSALVACSQLWL